jgi:hypothetical protein
MRSQFGVRAFIVAVAITVLVIAAVAAVLAIVAR